MSRLFPKKYESPSKYKNLSKSSSLNPKNFKKNPENQENSGTNQVF